MKMNSTDEEASEFKSREILPSVKLKKGNDVMDAFDIGNLQNFKS